MKTVDERKAEQRERSVIRIMNTCVHFTGIQHDSCKAEVNYHQQFGSGAGCFANIPCTHYPDEAISKSCPRVKYPTREEAVVEQDNRDAHSKKAMLAISAAHDDAKAKGYRQGNGGQDSMKCPLCTEGTLRYSVATINGHMHASCTNGCVSWME